MSLRGRSKAIVERVMEGERRTVSILQKRGMGVNGISQWMGVEKTYVRGLMGERTDESPEDILVWVLGLDELHDGSGNV